MEKGMSVSGVRDAGLGQGAWEQVPVNKVGTCACLTWYRTASKGTFGFCSVSTHPLAHQCDAHIAAYKRLHECLVRILQPESRDHMAACVVVRCTIQTHRTSRILAGLAPCDFLAGQATSDSKRTEGLAHIQETHSKHLTNIQITAYLEHIGAAHGDGAAAVLEC